MTTRRDFLASMTVATVGLGLGARTLLAQAGAQPATTAVKPAKPLKILILGGTGFLGPAVIDAAQARGHTVTIFNRGKREKLVGAREHTEKLYGNRDPEKHAEEETKTGPKGLEELKGKTWDGVVDTSGYFPRMVKASAELLAPSVGHYVFISTLSVYKNNDKPNMDESDELATMSDPKAEDFGAQMQNYGPGKSLCEAAAEAAMPGRVTSLRAGYIVGPGDTTDRFTYWPVTINKQAGEIVVPGAPTDPVQIIDVRDLAEFVVHCIETKAAGVMNACGPAKTLTNADVVAACLAASKKAGGKDATFTYVPYEWLEEWGKKNESMKFQGFPILLPSAGETAGFHTRKADKAIKAGLVFRSAQDTCSALLDWWPKAVALRDKVGKQQVEDMVKQGKEPPKLPPADRLRSGPSPEITAAILEAWKKDAQNTKK